MLTFLGRPSSPWNFRWWWAPSLCIRSAVARLASAASTAWTWSGFAWPSLSNLSVSKRPTLGLILSHQPESDGIQWIICHSPWVLFVCVYPQPLRITALLSQTRKRSRTPQQDNPRKTSAAYCSAPSWPTCRSLDYAHLQCTARWADGYVQEHIWI